MFAPMRSGGSGAKWFGGRRLALGGGSRMGSRMEQGGHVLILVIWPFRLD